jgi:hypothetical protein
MSANKANKMMSFNVVVGVTQKSIIACIALSGPAFFKLPKDVIKGAAVKKKSGPKVGAPLMW